MNQSRETFKKDLETSEKVIDNYINSIIKELQIVQEDKKRECRELHLQLDKEIVFQLNALEAYKKELSEIEII